MTVSLVNNDIPSRFSNDVRSSVETDPAFFIKVITLIKHFSYDQNHINQINHRQYCLFIGMELEQYVYKTQEPEGKKNLLFTTATCYFYCLRSIKNSSFVTDEVLNLFPIRDLGISLLRCTEHLYSLHRLTDSLLPNNSSFYFAPDNTNYSSNDLLFCLIQALLYNADCMVMMDDFREIIFFQRECGFIELIATGCEYMHSLLDTTRTQQNFYKDTLGFFTISDMELIMGKLLENLEQNMDLLQGSSIRPDLKKSIAKWVIEYKQDSSSTNKAYDI